MNYARFALQAAFNASRDHVIRGPRENAAVYDSLPKYSGQLKVDRKTGAWCYCERREMQTRQGSRPTLVPVVASLNWEPWMDSRRPEFVKITQEWEDKISLRTRHGH